MSNTQQAPLTAGSAKPKFTQEQLYDVFKQEDKNKDGILEESELFAALQKLGIMSLEMC